MELRRIDHDEFMTVAKALYGDGAWEIVKSRAPLSPEERKKKNERTQARVGLASNVVGIAAGAAGLAAASKLPALRKTGATLKNAGPVTGRLAGKLKSPTARRRLIQAGAGGAVGLQVANLAGDAVANRVLARSSKDPSKVKKSVDSFTVTATVSKAMDDKRQVYGWASITEMNGQPVVDLQGDYVTIEEIEKAAHKYISSSRKGGDMHLRDGDNPVHVADLIESVVITPEKKEALGLPADSPTGWWVGMQVNDEETWRKVRSGERPMFSIHGSGRRQEVEIQA